MKEAEDKALKKLEESKKKEDKEASGSKDKPKKKDKDRDAGVSVKQDHVQRGKVFHYGGTLGSPVGRTGNVAVVEIDLTDTDVPDDEDFLMEWDEWSEIEKGFGPKAAWAQDKGYKRTLTLVKWLSPPLGHTTAAM